MRQTNRARALRQVSLVLGSVIGILALAAWTSSAEAHHSFSVFDMQTNKELEGDGNRIRRIFTDGRQHPDDPDLTIHGHSVGHWEGDTLVVDTVGFTTDTFLGNQGMRHSDKMRIVERFRLAAPDQLEVQTTITDPQALTKPLARTAVYGRHRDWTLAEYVCQQNNRNFTTDDGKAGINLSFEETK